MTFDTVPIFGSSPLRTFVEPRGELLTPRAILGQAGGGSVPGGPFDVALTFTGRLIAETPSQLQSLVDTAMTNLTSPPTKAELVDDADRVWPDMSFVRFEPLGPAERRVCSLAFKAKFVALHE